MSNNKVARLMTLNEIFEDRFFVIPDYQRGYAWESSQREDLFQDIEYLLDESYTHFTGTIVAYNTKDNNYDIVDGQQRLTTLLMIIHEYLHITKQKNTDLIHRFSKVGNIGNERQKFIPNKETKEYFEKLIINNDSTPYTTINSHRNINNAKKEIRVWLEKQEDLKKLINVICTKLGFILYAPKNEKEIGIMFEVINNRGKSLSQLEKIKNFLIYYATKRSIINLHDAVNEQWGELLENLNKAEKFTSDDETAFLRYCWLVYFDKGKQKSYDVYYELKQRFPLQKDLAQDIDTVFRDLKGFLDFISLSSQNYADYFNASLSARLDDEVNKLLKSLRSQNIYGSIMPLILAVLSKLEKDKQVKLLQLIEKLNFRVYILPGVTSRADSGQGELFSLAYTFYNEYNKYHDEIYTEAIEGEEYQYRNITQWLEDRLIKFIKKYCSDKKMESALLNQEEQFDFYKWNGLRFFLMSYEEYININKDIDIEKILLGRDKKHTLGKDKRKTLGYYSIEHLWATNNRNKEGENNREKDRNLKKRLGNFALLEMRINIQAGDKSLENKIPIYLGKKTNDDVSDLKQIHRINDVFSDIANKYESVSRYKDTYYYAMYHDFIKVQENEYIKFAMERWKV